MCDGCWLFLEGDAPVCVACASFLGTRRARVISLTISALLLAGVMTFFASRHMSADLAWGAAVGLVLGAIVAVSVALGQLRSAAGGPGVRSREDAGTSVEAPLPGQQPYRSTVRVVASRALTRLSGATTTLVIAVSGLATASLVPVALRLPRWEKIEVVLAGWWLIGVCSLTGLLFRGVRLTDDYAYTAPRLPGSGGSPGQGPRGLERSKSTGGVDTGCLDPGCADPGCADSEGCAGIVVGVLVVAVGFAVAWALVELVAPLVFFLLYTLITRAVARATRDAHGCAGDFFRSLRVGAAWATAYFLPIAAVVWAVHRSLKVF
jgi:hypothetical protein